MEEQNYKVMQMSDAELQDIIKNGDKKTFLHFQAKREYNARHNGGKRYIEPTEKQVIESWYDNHGQFVNKV